MSRLNIKLTELNNQIAKATEKGKYKKVAKLKLKKEALLKDLRDNGLSIYDNGTYLDLPNPTL